MNDPYTAALEQSRKQWRASSILLQSQISDLQNLQQKIRAPWMQQRINEHIDFIIDLHNNVDDYVSQADHLIRLQQFNLNALNQTVQVYATQDTELFSNLIQKLKSNGSHK